MKHRPIALRRLLVVAGAALALPWAAHAQPVPDYYGAFVAGSMPVCGPPPGGPGPAGRGGDAPRPGHGFAGPEGGMPPPPMLRGLALGEAQRDKVFAILHAQAPTAREKARTASRAQDDLRALAESAQYDAAQAKSLAETAARALGELALLRAQSHHQVYLVLTDDQRQQMEAARPRARQP